MILKRYSVAIGPFVDEIFDKISCYFPINFTPPKNDKHMITPTLLKGKLARCFTASNLLAKQAIPFILDKMSATQVETKIECMELLQAMFSQDGGYEWATLEKHVAPGVSLMIAEYFNSPEEGCQRKIAQTIALLLKAQADQLGERGISSSSH